MKSNEAFIQKYNEEKLKATQKLNEISREEKLNQHQIMEDSVLKVHLLEAANLRIHDKFLVNEFLINF